MEVSQLIELMNAVSVSRTDDFWKQKMAFGECSKNIMRRISGTETVSDAAVCSSRGIRRNMYHIQASEEATGNMVKSPLVGIFYAAPVTGCRTLCTSGRYGKKRSGTWHRGSHETDE